MVDAEEPGWKITEREIDLGVRLETYYEKFDDGSVSLLIAKRAVIVDGKEYMFDYLECRISEVIAKDFDVFIIFSNDFSRFLGRICRDGSYQVLMEIPGTENLSDVRIETSYIDLPARRVLDEFCIHYIAVDHDSNFSIDRTLRNSAYSSCRSVRTGTD